MSASKSSSLMPFGAYVAVQGIFCQLGNESC